MAKMPKEIADKEILLATVKPRDEAEQQDFVEGIKGGLKKASSKVAGLGSWLAPITGQTMAKMIDDNRKYLNPKPTARTAVEFYLVLDANAGVYLDARYHGNHLAWSKSAFFPNDLEEARDFLRDLNKFSGELVNDSELKAWEKNNPSKALQEAYANRAAMAKSLEARTYAALKPAMLGVFLKWAKASDDYSFKVVEAVRKSRQKLPPAVAKRIDAAVQRFNDETIDVFDQRIRELGGEVPR